MRGLETYYDPLQSVCHVPSSLTSLRECRGILFLFETFIIEVSQLLIISIHIFLFSISFPFFYQVPTSSALMTSDLTFTYQINPHLFMLELHFLQALATTMMHMFLPRFINAMEPLSTIQILSMDLFHYPFPNYPTSFSTN